MIFDSIDMSPVLFGTGKSARTSWFYFTEDELSPGAMRLGVYKAVFNLRGDDGAQTGGLSVDTNLGWKGPSSYVATVPQIFDVLADPQERYDVFMNSFVENSWMVSVINNEIAKMMKTYIQYPPRKLQSVAYTGPITITNYQQLELVRQQLAKDGINLTMPNGN